MSRPFYSSSSALRIIAILMVVAGGGYRSSMTALAAEPVSVLNSGKADLSFDAGLWRTEFMASESDENEPAHPAQANNNTRLPRFDSLNTKRHLIPAIPFELSNPDLHSAVSDEDLAVVSDWDNAVANPATAGKKSQQVPGPSITSYIVGLVSAIVIIGGLVSGK